MSTYVISEEHAGKRLDVALAELTGQSRSFLQQALLRGEILLGGAVPNKKQLLNPGDELVCDFTALEALDLTPEAIPLDIRYEDTDLLVVNKPKGMVVHPAPGHATGTLVHALLHHCGSGLSGINGVLRPGIVHRIDKDTSGLLVVAKHDAAHRGLAAQLSDHRLRRVYRAIVHGQMREESLVLRAPIGRHPTDRKRMTVLATGKPAATHVSVRTRDTRGKFTELLCRLETGRTHQIRVHLARIHHPVAGDPVYSPFPLPELQGQCLHAGELTFTHPITGEEISCAAAPPEIFLDFLKQIL